MTAARSRSGMTLIEVILATLILSVGLVALLTAAGRCLAVVKRARDYQTARWVLGKGEFDYPPIIEEGIEDLEVFGETYSGGFVFSRSVDEDEDEDDLYVVRSAVTWAHHGGEAREEVVRYVFYEDEE